MTPPKSCYMFTKGTIKEHFNYLKGSHFSRSPNVLQTPFPVFQRHWKAQRAETCSSMRLFYFTCSTASWLQMAAVCSGLTQPAVGVGHMLTGLAACVGATAAHSCRRWMLKGRAVFERRELLWYLWSNKC